MLLAVIGFDKRQGIGTLTTILKTKEYNTKAESSNNYNNKNLTVGGRLNNVDKMNMAMLYLVDG